MSDDLVSAIGKLPEPYAAALRLRVAGASPDEVGEELKLEAAAVHPLLVIAEEKLRDLLMDPQVSEEAGTTS